MQSDTTWTVAVTVPAHAMSAVDDALTALGGTVAMHELDDGAAWRLIAYLEAPPDEGAVVTAIAAAAGDPDVAVAFAAIGRTDWVAYVEERSPPIDAGRFWVYGSHVRTAPPPDRIAIRLDAGMAFGSGTHETTRGCLMALSELTGAPVRRALDMGTGSGILAIAIARLWDAPVVACDVDPVAVEIARENAAANGVSARVWAVAGDGYATPAVGSNAPYDLVVANILANPLVEMAPALAAMLAADGTAVLSGLLDEQADEVIAAHAAVGLDLVGRTILGRWHTLTVRRGRGSDR
ncbi:MAG: 50S ribosomal protein L11 methyltransferase [Rhodospirillales bacterium]